MLPRLRYDQLISLCWLNLLPVCVAFIILVPCILVAFDIAPVTPYLNTSECSLIIVSCSAKKIKPGKIKVKNKTTISRFASGLVTLYGVLGNLPNITAQYPMLMPYLSTIINFTHYPIPNMAFLKFSHHYFSEILLINQNLCQNFSYLSESIFNLKSITFNLTFNRVYDIFVSNLSLPTTLVSIIKILSIRIKSLIEIDDQNLLKDSIPINDYRGTKPGILDPYNDILANQLKLAYSETKTKNDLCLKIQNDTESLSKILAEIEIS